MGLLRDESYVREGFSGCSLLAIPIGAVQIQWKRQVSPPPDMATFADAPTSHPFFQFVEVLAASGITAGCGGGNFCPDAPLMRA